MTVSVFIVQTALTAVLSTKELRSGLLVGFHDGSNVVVVSAAFCSQEEMAGSKGSVNALLPPPLTVVGAHVGVQQDVAAAQRALGRDSLVALPTGDNGLDFYTGNGQRGMPASVIPNGSGAGAVAEPLSSYFLPVRCSLDLVLQVAEPPGAPEAPSRALAAAFESLRHQACGPSTVYLMGEAAGSPAAGDGQPARLMLPGSNSLDALGVSWASPLSLRAFCTAGTGTSACVVPSARFEPSKAAIVCAALHLDVLCYARRAMPAQEAVEKVVKPAVCAQLDLMQRDAERRGDLAPQKALHFLPQGLGHHITLVYPLPTPSIEDDEEPLLGRRAQLHRLLGLPTNRPLLRVANALDIGAAAAGAECGGASSDGGGVGGKPRLADVHAGLAASGVGGSVHLIQGTYDYYHYMQDKFDDSGWGCAYRSLQTICSWFFKQLYTSRGVPSHREIQQALVSIGDKQQGFIGSKQWIGAIELGFVLDTLLGATCKVITVASGADMPSKAREIAHHFDTQGTPIMIGGGVLAYTLLGVDFNERTGDCAFLILDPHYTGPEDIKRIHAGQWVAWKKLGDKAAAGGDLFVQGAFYNLLCPQRPNTV